MAARLKNGWVTMHLVCRVEEYEQTIKPQLAATGYSESALLRSKFDLPISARGLSGKNKAATKKAATKRQSLKKKTGANKSGSRSGARTDVRANSGAIVVPPLAVESVPQDAERVSEQARESEMAGGNGSVAERPLGAGAEGVSDAPEASVPVAQPLADDDDGYTEVYDYTEADFALPEATASESGDQIRDEK